MQRLLSQRKMMRRISLASLPQVLQPLLLWCPWDEGAEKLRGHYWESDRLSSARGCLGMKIAPQSPVQNQSYPDVLRSRPLFRFRLPLLFGDFVSFRLDSRDPKLPQVAKG